MKAMVKFIGLLMIPLIAVACATTSFKLPEKYNFDNKLKEVKAVSELRIDSWQAIDSQSLIVKANINDNYLVILQQPAPQLPFQETIGISFSVNRVRPGYDNIIVSDSTGSEKYVINKIYKLKDQAQANEIRAQLRR